jgi:dipeptidyl aminopeptidase/acylaminoacyl peptidase
MRANLAPCRWAPIIALGFAAPAFAANGCDAMPPSSGLPAPERALTTKDLLSIRDIGSSYTIPATARAFTLSPDGTRVAFQIRRADAASNSYCFAMVVLDLRQGSRPVVIDRGGDYMRSSSDFRGKAGFPSGVPITITPHWSPDGKWIAFLKTIGPTTQVWRAEADGSASRPITTGSDPVTDVAIVSDARAILFASVPALASGNAAINRESLSGFLYDDRYSPMTRSRPFVPPPANPEIFVINASGGPVRKATEAEARNFGAPADSLQGAVEVARSRKGLLAWIVPPGAKAFHWKRTLAAQDAHGKTLFCSEVSCLSWVSRPWWTSDGQKVRFLRREGWGQSSIAIYEWTPATGRVRRLYRTDDLLDQCVPRKDALICLREASDEPRRLVSIDLSTQKVATLFDPNPEFGTLTLGNVERLHWKNAFGIESYADLVLPVSYVPGRRYPLIIVQYETRGFLRGGTGDEYPIQAFANRGYAVLSFSRPQDYGYLRARDESEVQVEDYRDFADRRSVQSSLDGAIGILTDRGLIDPAKIGITGLSDGAGTVMFGLINDPRFAAAAVSNCCYDPSTLVLTGPAAIRHFVEEGFPFPTDRADTFWKTLSLGRNADKIRTPILMQLSDDEYLTALDSFTALKQAGTAVELHVFPDEHHIKWQPAHRLAAYDRSIAWFDFWLRGIRPTDTLALSEVNRWSGLGTAGQ